MLPFEVDSTDAEKYQWVLYQLKVLEKCIVQFKRAMDSGKSDKILQVQDLLYNYGNLLVTEEYEFELEKLLNQHEVFERIRDLK